MKIIILTILLLAFQTTFGQTFVSDWTKFSDSKWTVKFLNDKSPHLDKNTQGLLIFQNIQNSKLQVVYYVFLKSDLDSLFKKKIKNWYFVQACLTFTNGNLDFYPFNFRQFYYCLKPCHNCDTKNNIDCAELANRLQEYILTDK